MGYNYNEPTYHEPTFKDHVQAFVYRTIIMYILFLALMGVLILAAPFIMLAIFIIKIPGSMLGFYLTRLYLNYVRKHPEKYLKENIIAKEVAKRKAVVKAPVKIDDTWKMEIKL